MSGRMFVRPRKQSGFALLLVIALLAFLVLLSVALATLTRVDSRASAGTVAAAQARLNARAAMRLALGRLQLAAGPDRRVTATADRVGGGLNPTWVGVWDTSTLPTSTPMSGWLVSGSGLEPGADLSTRSDAVQLVRTTAPVYGLAQDLRASDVPGFGAAEVTVGRFAWCVIDEGVKANLAVPDRVDEIAVTEGLTDPIGTIAQRDRVRQLLAHRSGAEALADELSLPVPYPGDGDSLIRWNALHGVLAREQWALGFADTADRFDYLRTGFGDFTPFSMGLLTNSAEGGERRNLSASPPGAALVAGVVDWDRMRPLGAGASAVLDNDPGTHLLPAGSAPLPTGASYGQVRPIITEISLDVVPYRRDSPGGGALSAPLHVGYRLRVEFWNPFPLPIQQTPGGTTAAQADYRVVITGLPTLRVSTPRQSVPWSADLDLNQVIPASGVTIDKDGNLAPGQIVRRSSEPVQSFVTTWVIPDETYPSTGAGLLDDRLDTAVPAGVLGFRFFRASDDPVTATPLFELVDVPFNAESRLNSNTTTTWWVNNNTPFSGGGGYTGSGAVPTHGVTFHVRLDPGKRTWGQWVNPAVPESGPATPGGAYAPDLRQPRLVYDYAVWDTVNAGGEALDPVTAARQISSQWSTAEFFSAATVQLAYDAPQQRVLSVGALHHLGFGGQRPFALGNAWGADVNGWFDRYFFNPVPASWIAGDVLPNPRHRVLADPLGRLPTATDLGGDQAANWVGMFGMFNVNSVSVPAWRAVLGHSIAGWAPEAGAAVTLRHAYFGFPQSASYAYDARTSMGAQGRGWRSFSDAQISALATQVVAGIRARPTPFRSVAEFVNSGVLQGAIREAGLNDAGGDLSSTPSPYNPAYLTQAHLLSVLAPVLSARSDTFVIRGYGETVNPATGLRQASARCEAVVQRLPAEFAPVSGDSGEVSRRFKLVLFRWLTPYDP